MVGFTVFESVITSFVFILTILVRSCYPIDSLYNDKDDVISLRDSNFDQTILATSNSWLVEFYNSWCGHCVRFAPIYRQLATDVKAWGPFLKVAAADCSQDYNTALCQYFNINLFPTLKFFPAFASKRTNGTSCPGVDSVESLGKSIVNFISNGSLSNLGDKKLQLLQPVKNLTYIWHDSNERIEQAVLIFETQFSYLGRQVILDMYSFKRLVIRRMLENDVSTYGISELPSMFLVNKTDGSFKKLASGNNRTEYIIALKKLVLDESRIGASNHVDDNQVEKPLTTEIQKKDFDQLSENYLRVHEQDLESSLHYSLRHEVALHQVISDEPLLELKRYVNVLSKYLPVQKPISSFLKKLNSWLQDEPGPIKGSDWLKTINQIQTSSEYLPESTTWTGCRGSDSKYRGYPCSLWTTFHTLTIAAYDEFLLNDRKALEGGQPDVIEVLLAIRGYVKYFFGCRECSQNFMKSAVHIEEKVKNQKSAVLFLWSSHNRANSFLAGDMTEDPKHPKLQFPTYEQCPICHMSAKGSKNEYDETEVIAFLRNMYSKTNLISDSRLFFEKTNEQIRDLNDEVRNFFNSRRKRNDQVLRDKPHDHDSDLNSDTANRTYMKHISSSGFGNIDIGMCFLFYIFCMLILILVYLRFSRHRLPRILNSCRLLV